MKPPIYWSMSRDAFTLTFEFKKHEYENALLNLPSREITSDSAAEVLLRLHQIAKYIEDQQTNAIQTVTVDVIQPQLLPPSHETDLFPG
jgi:hypothetical protein